MVIELDIEMDRLKDWCIPPPSGLAFFSPAPFLQLLEVPPFLNLNKSNPCHHYGHRLEAWILIISLESKPMLIIPFFPKEVASANECVRMKFQNTANLGHLTNQCHLNISVILRIGMNVDIIVFNK